MASVGRRLMTIGEAAAALRRREISSLELTEAALARIAERNPHLNAYITVTAGAAVDDARRADAELRAGVDRGPLHGIPLGVKDLYDTAGVRTTAGSSFFAERVPAADATAVARLRAAGMVLTGKHNTHEFAYGTTTINPHYGPARNPHEPSRIPGGSSGGSAVAVADGMCYGALGTDTGGSIRGPAALCGIVGLKPTFGRVPRTGIVPLSWSLDHAGPLARTVADTALLLQAVAGHDPADPSSSTVRVPNFSAALEAGVTGLRLGMVRGPHHDQATPAVKGGVAAAVRVLAAAGAEVSEVSAPLLDDAEALSFTVSGAEAAAYHLRRLQTAPEGFGPDVRDRLESAASLPATTYINAQRARRLLTMQIDAWFGHVDVVVLPAAARTAPLIGPNASAQMRAFPSPRRPFNLTGHPAISVPCGFDEGGLPTGLQVVGRYWDEATVLRVASTWERLSGE